MKLIDLLVQELPKRGGWPGHAKHVWCDPDGEIRFREGGCKPDFYPESEVDVESRIPSMRQEDDPHYIVTREQYEAALAASQRCVHEWIPSEGRTSSGVLCRKCGDYDGPGEDEKMKESNSQIWDGEGFPPVGCRIEAFSGGEWVEAIVTYNERPECHGDAAAWKEVLAFDCKTTRPFWTDEFRPIRSEADRKRDAIISVIEQVYKQCPHSDAVPYAVYDAIAAGNIPHIRIE
ncbi:hypothetical protein [Cronobacter sakazakii]|uniref:hypothetical protein n=1 Tax=Cronobacter sakazakii TaxID=28141 RepID=UPI000CFE1FFE|nr:hypothetical protein [Cronobacter sakazakii]